MMSRIPRRSSVAKESNQVSRPSPQEVEGEKEGIITQMTSGRVIFSQGNTFNICDFSLDDQTKMSKSSRDSLESNEDEENQSMSANVFDKQPAVHAQKKPKRKRVPTVQPSLNSSSLETSILNQSPLRSSDTRAVKQPRKSIDSPKEEFLEEGDTQMFFDELNLTEPIMCSYSNMDSSLSITRTLMGSVLEHSCVTLGKSPNDSADGVLSESTLKNLEQDDSLEVNCSVGGVLDSTLLKEDRNTMKNEPDICGEVSDEGESLNMSVDGINMECTLTAGNLGVGDSFSNADTNIDPNCSISSSNAPLSVYEDCISEKKSNNSSASIVGTHNDVLLPVTPTPGKNPHSRPGEDPLDETCYVEARMDLTIPPVMKELNLSTTVECQEGNMQDSQDKQDLEPTDLEVTDTWGQNSDKRNSMSSLVNVLNNDVAGDNSKLSSSITEETCVEYEVSNCTVSSNPEISMRSSGLVIQENMVEECLNSTRGSDTTVEAGVDMVGKGSVTPSREMIVFKFEDDLERDSSLKTAESCEVAFSDAAGSSNVMEDLSTKMKERTLVEKTILYSNSNALDETCADVHGMDMTVPLGKIKDKMDKSVTEDIMTQGSDKNGSLSGNLMNELEEGNTIVEDKKTEELTNTEFHLADSGLQKPGLSNDDESQIMKDTEFASVAIESNSIQQEFGDEPSDQPASPESSVMDLNISVKNIQVNESGNLEDVKVESLEVDSSLPQFSEMDSTYLSEKVKEGICESPTKPLSQSLLMDDTISGTMCMEMTVPLGRFKGETQEYSVDNVLLDSLNLSETKYGAEEINIVLPNSQTMDETTPEVMGMEFTVPLGRFKEETHESFVSNSLAEPHIVDETKGKVVEANNTHNELHAIDVTAAEVTGMELTIPLGRFKEEIPKCSINNMLSNSQIVDKIEDDYVESNMSCDLQMRDEKRSEVLGMELTISLGEFKEEIKCNTDNEVSSSQVIYGAEDDAVEISNMPPDLQTMDGTFPEAVGMECTVPLERFVEDTHDHTVDNVLSVSQIIGGTTVDGNSDVGLDVSTDKIKTDECGDNPEVEDTFKKDQIPFDMDTEAVEAEPCAPLAEEESTNLTTTILEDYKDVDATKDHSMCLQATSQLTEKDGLQSREKDTGTATEMEAVANVITDSMGMESSEIKAVDSTLSDSSVTLSQIMDDTISDAMGMEMTLPLGRLKQRRSKYTSDPLKAQRSFEINTGPVSMQFSSPSLTSEDENTPNSSVGNESPKAYFETSIIESGIDKLVVGSNDHVPQAEHTSAPVDTTNANPLEEICYVPSGGEEGRNFDHNDGNSSKLISCDDVDILGDGVGLNISVSLEGGPKNPDGFPIESSKCELEVENHLRDVQVESSIPLKVEGESMGNEQQDGIVSCIPEPEAMDHSLSEAMGSDLCNSKDIYTSLEIKILEVDCEDNKLETDSQSHSVGTTERIPEERKSLSPSKGSLCNNLIEKPGFEDCSNMEIVGVESSISLAEPNEREYGDLILYESEDSYGKVGHMYREMLPESPMVKCDEEINQEVKVDAEYEKQEELVPEREPMDQSLSDVVESEVHSADCVDPKISESELKVGFEKTAIETDDCQETFMAAATNLKGRLSLSHSISVKGEDQVGNTKEETIAEGGKPNSSQIPECPVETESNSRDEPQALNISSERFEDFKNDGEVEEVKNEEKEENILEQEAMDQSLAEAAENECGTVDLNVSKPMVELNVTIHHSDHDDEVVAAPNTTFNENLSANLIEGRECGDLTGDPVETPALEDNNSKQEDEARLSVSLIASDVVEYGDSILNESLESYTEFETFPRDVSEKSDFSVERCDEKLDEEAESGEVEYQETEECVLKQEAMEQSPSEPIQNEPQPAKSDEIEFQRCSDSSFSAGELMEISNTPVKGLETPKSKNAVHDTSVQRSLEVPLEDASPNSACAESDVNTFSVVANDDLQPEEELNEKSYVHGEQSLSNINCSYLEREENKEADTTFDEQNHKEIGEASVEVNKTIDIPLSPINTPIVVTHNVSCVNIDSTDQLLPPKGYDGWDGEANVADSQNMSKQEWSFVKERSDNLSYDPEDTIMTLADDVTMECIAVPERDSGEVGDDALETMSDVSDAEALESNWVASRAEIKTDLFSDSDNFRVKESGKIQLSHEPSNEEEAVEKTSSVMADTPESSIGNLKVDDAAQGEDSKTADLIEDWIREESSKETCVWANYEHLKNQYSFSIFHDAAVLIVNLTPMNEGQGYGTVEGVELKSSISDNSDRCLLVVMNVMLNRLSSSLLSTKCSSTEQLPSLFQFLESEFSVMNQLLLQLYELMRNSSIRLKNDSFSFLVPNTKKMLLFEVQVDLLNWNECGVKSEDIHVKNVIGKIGSTEIQSVFQSVRCDEHYLRNTYKEVLNFTSTLEMVF